MKIKTGVLLIILFLGFYSLKAQQVHRYDNRVAPQKGFQKDKMFFGGNLGLSFGNTTYINFSPLIGYRFTDMLAAGVQLNGVYESVNYGTEKDKYGMLGVGAFGRLYPIPQIFLQLQPEINFIMGKTQFANGNNDNKYRDNATAFLAGGGYSQSMGGNSAFVIMILFDVLQNDNSPYGNQPIFRAGVNIGF